jgi:flagellar biosynthesis protein FliP
MAKITAWLVTLLGLLLVLNLIPSVVNLLVMAKWVNWVIALAVLAVGVTKLIRNYTKK